MAVPIPTREAFPVERAASRERGPWSAAADARNWAWVTSENDETGDTFPGFGCALTSRQGASIAAVRASSMLLMPSTGTSMRTSSSRIIKGWWQGRPVRTLANRYFTHGSHDLIWNGTTDDGRAAASGVYFYRLKTARKEFTKKMVLLR